VTPDQLPDPIYVAVQVAAVLDRVGLEYVIGGSFASSLHGEPRSTNDVDIVVDIRPDQISELIGTLGMEYYIAEDAARDAVLSAGSFNVIHIATAVKVDVFIPSDDFDHERLARRQLVHIPTGLDANADLFVDTAEDTVLRKLEWFRRGGEVSERQWRDVVGILRAQTQGLDSEHLRKWSDRLGVSDLLGRAIAEADASEQRP
jgi:hypothetical protein